MLEKSLIMEMYIKPYFMIFYDITENTCFLWARSHLRMPQILNSGNTL